MDHYMRDLLQGRTLQLICAFAVLYQLVSTCLLIDRPVRFEDEDVAIASGDYLLATLEASLAPHDAEKDELRRVASIKDANNGIGYLVAVPAAIIFRLRHNIIDARYFLQLFNLIFWVVLFSLWLLLAKTLLKNPETPLILGLCGLALLWFVDGVPMAHLSRNYVLGEYPATAIFLSAIFFLFQGRVHLAALMGGLAGMTKFNYFLYAPVFIIGPFLGLMASADGGQYKKKVLDHLRILVLSCSIYLLPSLTIQALKLLAFGWHNYWQAWAGYLNWFIYSSGTGLSGHHVASLVSEINEWPDYSWRTKAYYCLGSIGPLFFLFALWLRRASRHWIIFAFLLACVVFVGSAQWMWMAKVKWWRRSLFFVVPGYTLFWLGNLILMNHLWSAWSCKIGRPLGRSLLVYITMCGLLALAAYVNIRQSLVGVLENSLAMPSAERRYLIKKPGRIELNDPGL